VSQSVVREALLEMQFTGLVESVDNLGVFVASVNRTKVLQAYQVREMMEGLAARLCCQTTSVADIRELTEIADKIYDLGINNRDRERADLDRHFHDRIFELAQNEVLKRLAGSYHIVRLVVLKDFPHQQVREDHQKIVQAIQDNDPEAAERAGRAHVIRARAMIEQQLSGESLQGSESPVPSPSGRGLG
jgi:DNA-binding GntR family transcriptional regulator